MNKNNLENKKHGAQIEYPDMDNLLEDIYTRYHKNVFNHLFFCCNDYELSRDLAQETFLKIWDRLDKIKLDESILPYLIKVSGNLLKDHYRHHKVKQKYIELNRNKIDNYSEQEQNINANQLEMKVRQIIHKKLSHQTRTIFIMSRYEGKSNEEISNELNIAKKTTENQLYTALSIIRENIKHLL